MVFKEKNSTISQQRRATAEKHKLLDDYKQALMYANAAVIRAPATINNMHVDADLSLAMALRTRASILIQLADGEAALSDLKLAATYSLDYKQSMEYYLNMARAYAVMHEMPRAQIALSIAEKLPDSDPSQIAACRQELIKVENIAIAHKKILEKPALSMGANTELLGASKGIKLAQSADKGRCIVAAKSLRTGEVILCEKPVAACLLPIFYGSHCLHCLKRLIVPIPCNNCSGIAFCSALCMSEVCDTYHRFECNFMDLLLGSGMSILCYIALRIFTQASNIDSALNLANTLYTNMVSHQDPRQTDDQLQRTLMAAFLLRVLQKAHYFGRRHSEGVSPTGLELQVGSALLGLLQILQYNAHEIYETLQDPAHNFDNSRIVYVGAGLYRTGAYFNHECWPTVTRYFVGKELVLATIRPHQVNDVVAENYGPVFIKKNLKERQCTLHGRYLFSCTCVVCRENWPNLQKLDKQVRFYCPTRNCSYLIHCPRDISKDVRCPRCRKNVSLKEHVIQLVKVEELYPEAAEAMTKQNTASAVELFTKAIDMFFEIAALPHRDTIIAQQSLMKCMADTGNTAQIIQ